LHHTKVLLCLTISIPLLAETKIVEQAPVGRGAESPLQRLAYFGRKVLIYWLLPVLKDPAEPIVGNLKQSRFPTSFLPKKLLFKNRSIRGLSNRSDFEI
jgi:hypothetical protein